MEDEANLWTLQKKFNNLFIEDNKAKKSSMFTKYALHKFGKNQ